MVILEDTRKRLRRSTCGAAFDYAIAVPEGQIGGRYDLFLFNRTQHPASILRNNFLLNKKKELQKNSRFFAAPPVLQARYIFCELIFILSIINYMLENLLYTQQTDLNPLNQKNGIIN